MDMEDPVVARVLTAQLQLAHIERRLNEARDLLYEMERRADAAVTNAKEAEEKLKRIRTEKKRVTAAPGDTKP